MSPIPNPTILFSSIPTGPPTPQNLQHSTTHSTIDLDASLNEDELVLKLVVVSLDPYFRGRMRDEGVKSYSPAFKLGEPIQGHVVAKVIKSTSSRYPEGTHVYGVLPYTTYQHLPAPSQADDIHSSKFFGGPKLRILENKENLPWSAYIGAAGMPGKTGWMGWREISEIRERGVDAEGEGEGEGEDGEGKCVYVSAGSGPVGQMVIQVAKKDGCKVIASAGSAEKVQLCKDYGADVAFNYKEEKASDIFEKHAPEGITVNWVNVGGEAFDEELKHMRQGGRIIVCGWISGYNGESYGVKNFMQVLSKRLKIRGFIVGDFEPQYATKFYSQVPAAIASGKLKFAEVKYQGLESIPEAFVELIAGKQGGGMGLGKVVIEV